MRKKRRLKGQAEAAEAIAREHAETPEIAEAIEGAALAQAYGEEERAKARAALLATLAARTEAGEAEDGAGAATAAAEGEAAEATEAAAPAELTAERVASIVESLLFAADKPLGVRELRSLLRIKDVARIEAAIEHVRQRHEGSGLALQEVAGGWQFRTASENSGWVQQLIAGRPVRLSRAQLETLAIVAYRQPITRPEIDEIRGVDSGSTLKVLMDRDLVRVLGKREEVGRPLIYGTTREFLEFFHLKDLRELPTLREFHELSEDSLREVEALDREDEGGGGRGARRGRAAADEAATFAGDDLAGDDDGVEGAPAFAVIDASEQGEGPTRAAEELN